MLLIPAGKFIRGKNSPKLDGGFPHEVAISAFYLDETLVTNEKFKKFISETGFKTSGEIKGYGMVAKEGFQDWQWVRANGADWNHPFGRSKKSSPPGENHPVVSVSWRDADAYCKWAQKRLPTEAEFEYAARAGEANARFPWGDSPIRPDGKVGLNFWQGARHGRAESTDGFVYTSPVKAFPPNKWGMYDPVGNVWQWVADWYSKSYFREFASKPSVVDPQGPKSGKLKVARGGSWWCSESTCHGYGLFYRGKSHPNAVFNNNGFRCAKSI